MQGWSRWIVVVVSSSSVDPIICYDGYFNVEHVICKYIGLKNEQISFIL
jgi:hypothetical protein